MVVDKEQGQQSKVLSRFERERLDLSVSVVETLREGSQAGWLDELSRDEGFQPTSVQNRLTTSPMFFPPRLSLQSRPMPVVKPGTENMHEMEGWKSTTNTHESVLLRFAQRLTASFIAVDANAGRSAAPYVVQPCDKTFKPSEPPSEQTEAEQPTAKRKSLPPIPSLTQNQKVHPGVQRQRLAGRHSKIRLETAPMATTFTRQYGSHLEQRIDAGGRDKTELSHYSIAHEFSVTSSHLPIVGPELEEGVTGNHLPIIELLRKYEQSLSSYLPALRGGASVETLSGSGVFESGQGESIILNPVITPSSVVLVTLTANPGPVVVQYISLQPKVGFTIHLTAPAAMRTPFNYVVVTHQEQ
ncbi:hypothetical protein [Tengunoibacter tsumagoiensis]|uniref:Uncharacterized protein n=1 Tax=Tengunoibacter tsumagoiensis TaxID=2014871 RepID=A0A402A285_9CHLR|nr:hypothetical protein [Tengunoibacter tsumagoiensis]GCE13172.1 hypothetical protein KTT_30310 [Tengunoibacter tsumagoiensis]